MRGYTRLPFKDIKTIWGHEYNVTEHKKEWQTMKPEKITVVVKLSVYVIWISVSFWFEVEED